MLRLRAAAAALVAAALGGGTAAADEGFRFAAPAGTYDWSGFYVGGHLGWGWSNVDTQIVEPGIVVDILDFLGAQTSASNSLDGFLAGGHLGLQHQFGRWVVGIEGSFSGSPGGFDGSSGRDFADSIPFGPFSLDWQGQSQFSAEISQLLMVTGRLGYAWDNWLAYLKGGYASAKIGVDYDVEAGFELCGIGCLPVANLTGTASSEERHHGWTLGAGLEHAIKPNVIVGIEYNYIDLGAKTHTANSQGCLNTIIGGGCIDFDSKLRVNPDAIHTVYARLSFKLGREAPAPVPLK